MHHFVRVGQLGHVGRFAATDAARYARGTRVICRTRRGLELGEVLSTCDASSPAADGTVLRRVTVEDELLASRLEKHRDAAYLACAEKLAERGLRVILVDVEHLFDGQSLFFYFLGETTPALDELTSELAAIYDARIQFRQFAETLANGCGPDCGTEGAAGHGCASGGCSICAVGCKTHSFNPEPTATAQ
jgi:cell fate regulator YaaT (PSP1 superfamily)